MAAHSAMGKDFILFASKAHKLLLEGNAKQSLNLCEAGVRRFPFYADGHYMLGVCYQHEKKYDEAKNEFERTLVYDPAHRAAMQKLADINREKGLTQIADEWLLKQAMYAPAGKGLIEQLKEKNLYSQIDFSAVKQPMVEPETEDNPQEIGDIALQEEVTAQAEQNAVEFQDVSTAAAKPEEDLILDELDDEPLDTLNDVTAEGLPGDETDAQIKETDIPEADKIDPLAAPLDEEPEEKEEELSKRNLSQYANVEDDFSTIMEGIFESEEDNSDEAQAENDEWIEVENLLIDEETDEGLYVNDEESEDSISSIDPLPPKPKDETEMLLQELSNAERKAELDVFPAEDAEMLSEDEEPAQEAVEENADAVDEVAEATEKVEVDASLEAAEQAEPEQPVAKMNEETAAQSAAGFTPPQPAPLEIQPESDSDDAVTIKDLMENPSLVTTTFGEILVAQRKFTEARHVFQELAKKEPDNPRYVKKIQFLDKFLEAQELG